jgi:hypothetical protein
VHELESQSADAVPTDIDDASEPETSEPIRAQARQREGLPPQYRMRAERHYVDHLSAPSSSAPVQLIPISQLSPGPQSASRDLDALVRSIRAHGILQPLLVRRDRTGYHVIAGSKRFGAAIAAGLAEVPCIVHHVDEAGAAALGAAERVRGERAGGGLRASVGGRIAEGVTAIADDLSRIRATVGLLRNAPTGFQQEVATDLLAAQTWRALWLANVASFLSGGKYPEGRSRPLPVVVDDIVERFDPECRLSRLRFTVHHQGVPAPHVADGPVGLAVTSAIIVTLALLEAGAEPALEIQSQRLGERGFVVEVVQRHSLVPKDAAERFSNQALSAPAPGNIGLGALALSHLTAPSGGASELLVTEEPGSTLRLTFPQS